MPYSDRAYGNGKVSEEKWLHGVPRQMALGTILQVFCVPAQPENRMISMFPQDTAREMKRTCGGWNEEFLGITWTDL